MLYFFLNHYQNHLLKKKKKKKISNRNLKILTPSSKRIGDPCQTCINYSQLPTQTLTYHLQSKQKKSYLLLLWLREVCLRQGYWSHMKIDPSSFSVVSTGSNHLQWRNWNTDRIMESLNADRMVFHWSTRHKCRAKAKAQSVFSYRGWEIELLCILDSSIYCINYYTTLCTDQVWKLDLTGCIDGWQPSPSSSTGSTVVECSLKRSSWMESCFFMNFVAVTSNSNEEKLMPKI